VGWLGEWCLTALGLALPHIRDKVSWEAVVSGRSSVFLLSRDESYSQETPLNRRLNHFFLKMNFVSWPTVNYDRRTCQKRANMFTTSIEYAL